MVKFIIFMVIILMFLTTFILKSKSIPLLLISIIHHMLKREINKLLNGQNKEIFKYFVNKIMDYMIL